MPWSGSRPCSCACAELNALTSAPSLLQISSGTAACPPTTRCCTMEMWRKGCSAHLSKAYRKRVCERRDGKGAWPQSDTASGKGEGILTPWLVTPVQGEASGQWQVGRHLADGIEVGTHCVALPLLGCAHPDQYPRAFFFCSDDAHPAKNTVCWTAFALVYHGPDSLLVHSLHSELQRQWIGSRAGLCQAPVSWSCVPCSACGGYEGAAYWEGVPTCEREELWKAKQGQCLFPAQPCTVPLPDGPLPPLHSYLDVLTFCTSSSAQFTAPLSHSSFSPG